HAVELVVDVAGEAPAQVGLMLGEDVDAEDAGLLDLGPARRVAAWEEPDQGWLERHRRERADRESLGVAVPCGGDDGDTCRKVPEDVTKAARVEVGHRLQVRGRPFLSAFGADSAQRAPIGEESALRGGGAEVAAVALVGGEHLDTGPLGPAL